MDSVVHIITVGTSLLSNTGGAGRTGNNTQKVINLNKEVSLITHNTPINDGRIRKITDLLLDIDPKEELSYRGTPNVKYTDRLPQEISYLYINCYEKNKSNDHKEDIYLLPTDTNESIICAEVIKQYISDSEVLKNYYNCLEIKPISGIDTYDGERFQKEGVKNLFTAISEIVNNSQNAQKIYINITGGYKAIVPYTTLQGMLYNEQKVVICYLYEDSPNIIEIPAYPIGLDFQLWHINAIRLKMVMQGKDYFKKNLDVRILNVLSDTTLDTLGKQLKDQYDAQLKEDPLEVYSKEIIKLILPESENSELRRNLYEIIEKAGVLIWTGDKVPEMVEHARRHHHDLLEFAEMLLTPIISTNKNYFTSYERFCLLAGILLHDCGHSIDYIELDNGQTRIPLFPSEIRDYHHLLTAQRLKSEKLARDLGFNKEQLDKINPKLHEAVIDVSLYHRKKMSFFEKDNPFTNPFNNITYEALELKNSYYQPEIDIMKVVAFMRVIDGCDIQTRRAGTKEQVDITLSLLREDYQTAYQRAINAYDLYRSMYDDKFGGLKYFIKKEDTIRLSKDYMPYRIDCLEKLQKGLEEDSRHANLWLMTAELIDRSAMKHRQEGHYEKHQCIKEVLITNMKREMRNYTFEITLTPTDYLNSHTDKEKMKVNILKEMRGEYESVEAKMEELSIKITYKFNDTYI